MPYRNKREQRASKYRSQASGRDRDDSLQTVQQLFDATRRAICGDATKACRGGSINISSLQLFLQLMSI